MKIKSMVLLFLVISLSLAAEYSFLTIPSVSSANLAFTPTSGIKLTAAGAQGGQNFPTNVTIKGNITISGNNDVSFVGAGPSNPAVVYLNGSINIVDNGTLVLKYVKLYLSGAKKPYDRYIRLFTKSPNNHPRLIIYNATLDDYATKTTKVVGRFIVTVSTDYGCAIYAYNNSQITAQSFNFYRDTVNASTFVQYGPTVIKCYGESSANITNCKVDSVLAYDEARVMINTGSGPKRIPSSSADAGIGFGCYDNSIVNLYGVTFSNTTVAGSAHLLLTRCQELSKNTLTTMDQSNCTIRGQSTFSNSPCIIETGDSFVYVSSSTLSATLSVYPVVNLNDNATFVVVQEAMITGMISAFDYSKLVLNDTNSASGLINDIINGYNSSSVSIFNCTLSASPYSCQVSLSDRSSLSLVDSRITYGWINLVDNTALYVWGSVLTGSRIVCRGNARLTLAGGSIIADSVEMYDETKLGMESSIASVIYCGASSHGSFVNSSVSSLLVRDSASVETKNSTLHEFSLTESNVAGSIVGLTGFLRNSTFEFAGSSLDVSLLNTTIDNVDFLFLGNSNVTISNSTIRNLSLQGSSIVRLNNAPVTGPISVANSSRVLAFSPLRVHCVDYFGNALNGSVVSIETTYAGKTVVLQQRTADKNGYADFVVFSELDNATGSFPLGTVTVEGNSGGVSTSQNVNVAIVNKDVTLSFPLPSWSIYLLPVVILVVIIALLTLIYYVVKRIRKTKQ